VPTAAASQLALADQQPISQAAAEHLNQFNSKSGAKATAANQKVAPQLVSR
jgi:hypothetical protein